MKLNGKSLLVTHSEKPWWRRARLIGGEPMKKTVTIAYAVIVIALGSSVFAGEIEGVLPGFEVPRASKDQHGNPILIGIGKKTKLPREISHKKTGIEFILIESGEFQMGSITIIGAQPIHTVKITKPFYLGKYEVTNQQYWKAVFEDFPVDKIIRPNSPAEAVSWNYAREFCLDLGGDLPTEAQWEYACRMYPISIASAMMNRNLVIMRGLRTMPAKKTRTTHTM